MKRVRVIQRSEYVPGRTIEAGDMGTVISDIENERLLVVRFDITDRRFGVATFKEETVYIPRTHVEFI